MISLTTPLLVFDLELTAPEGAGHESAELIEIGAVLLAPSLDELGRFSALIRPEQPLNPRIAALTGISAEMLEAAARFSEVIEGFETWLREYCPKPRQLRLCAWGAYGDIPALRAAYAKVPRAWPYPGSAVDAKSIATAWLALSGRRADQSGLAKVAKIMQLAPVGAWHRALVDADATARILARVFSDLDAGAFLPADKPGARQLIRLAPAKPV